MHEAMAIEALTASFLANRLETAFHGSRYPVYTGRGTYQTTDLDAWAAAPRRGMLALAECKAQWGARYVRVLRAGARLLGGPYTREAASMITALFADDNAWVSEYFGFSEPGDDAWTYLRSLEIWLVGNVDVVDEEAAALDEQFTAELREEFAGHCEEYGVEITGFVRPTIDVLAETIEQIGAAVAGGWGRRFGDAQLDLFREIARYRQAMARGGGQGASVRAQARAARRMAEALGLRD